MSTIDIIDSINQAIESSIEAKLQAKLQAVATRLIALESEAAGSIRILDDLSTQVGKMQDKVDDLADGLNVVKFSQQEEMREVIRDFDFSTMIEEEVEAALDNAITEALHDYDFSAHIKAAVDDIDIGDAVEKYLSRRTFNLVRNN